MLELIVYGQVSLRNVLCTPSATKLITIPGKDLEVLKFNQNFSVKLFYNFLFLSCRVCPDQ